MSTDKLIARRKEVSMLRWRYREINLKKLQDSGLEFKQPAKEGPGSGVAWVKTPKGLACYKLATNSWRIDKLEKTGRGIQSLKQFTGIP